MLISYLKTFLVITVIGCILFWQDSGRSAAASSEGAEQLPIEVIAHGKAFPSMKEYRNSQASPEVPPLAVEESLEPAMGLIPGRSPQERLSDDLPPAHPANSEVDERGWKTLQVSPVGGADKSLSAVVSDTLRTPPENVPPAPDNPQGIGFVAGVSPAVSEVVKDFQKRPEAVTGQAERIQTSQELTQKLASQADKAEGPLLLMSDGRKIKLMDLKKEDEGEKSSDQVPEGVVLDKTRMPSP